MDDNDAASSDTLLPRSSLSASEFTEKRARRSNILFALGGFLGLSLVINVFLCLVIYSEIAVRKSPNLYSPAQDAVEYKLITFDSSLLSDITEYQGPPTERNNKLWNSLYRHMNTHVSEEQARLLPNKTAPEAPYEGSGYLLVLHVFHDLHCLDKIRQALYYFAHDQWNSTYNPYVLFSSPSDALSAYGGEAMRITHLDHCIDALRQSIQCHADIAPNVFQYSPKAGFIGARANVVHECRDFNKIVEWADEHKSRLPFEGFGDGPELGKCGWDDPAGCLGE